MDISKEYIEMCEKAQEIQEQWKHSIRNNGDWYFNEELNGAYVVSDIDQGDNICVWLPRQDQLQDMLNRSVIEKLIKFNDFMYPPLSIIKPELSEEKLKTFPSFEQLWLRFVMKEKYNKIWDINCKNWENVG